MSDRPAWVDDLITLVGSRTAAEVMKHTTLPHLAAATLSELQSFLPDRAARKVYAAMRLGRRALEPRRDDEAITCAEKAYAHIYPYVAGLETEHLLLVCCDVRYRPIHTEVIAQGVVNSVSGRLADLFVPAVRHRASAIILAHNHPSGSVEPSTADVLMTNNVLKAAELIDITLLDHLVVANTGFHSLRDHWPDLGKL